MTPIRVMIVDDHAVVRDGLQALLTQQAELAVVGLAADGIEALQMARERQPDVVLMDLGMPRMGGIEATRRCWQCAPPWPLLRGVPGWKGLVRPDHSKNSNDD